MSKIVDRDDLIGLNSFAKLFGLTRKEVDRIAVRSPISGIRIKDGNIRRVFLDLGALRHLAKAEGVTTHELVRRFCRQSKR